MMPRVRAACDLSNPAGSTLGIFPDAYKSRWHGLQTDHETGGNIRPLFYMDI
jgi:hypothetical protein